MHHSFTDTSAVDQILVVHERTKAVEPKGFLSSSPAGESYVQASFIALRHSITGVEVLLADS